MPLWRHQQGAGMANGQGVDNAAPGGAGCWEWPPGSNPEIFRGPVVMRIMGIKVVTWDRDSDSQKTSRTPKQP